MRERKGELSIKLLGDKVHGMSMFLLEKILAVYARKVKNHMEVCLSRDENDKRFIYLTAKDMDDNKRKLEPFIYQTYENDTTIPDQMRLELLDLGNGEIGVVEYEEILEIAKKQEEKRREDVLNGLGIHE